MKIVVIGGSGRDVAATVAELATGDGRTVVGHPHARYRQ
jgi:hypothetical protein